MNYTKISNLLKGVIFISMLATKSSNTAKNDAQSGQTFVEFVLLMSVLALLSVGVLSAFNGGIAEAWVKIVSFVAGPTPASPANLELL